MSRFRQRGVALLVAIVIFAVATTVAAAITYNKAMTARRAAATFTLEQALQAGMAAEALAALVLENDATKPRTDTKQDWAQDQPPFEIPDTGVWVQGKIEDLTGRFNLNSVLKWNPQTNAFEGDPEQVAVFENLLRDLNIDVRYADLLVDWLDTNIAPENQGGEDSLYLTQVPPYRPPNFFIWHPSELLALPKFGRDNYLKIAPFVTALPYDEPLNVCTARAFVLDATLNNNQSQYTDDFLKQQRDQNGCFPLKAVYTAPLTGAQKGVVDAKVDEKSSWFQLRTNIRVGTAEFVLYSLLYREPGSNKTRTVQRSFGSE
jgi:general secretion pathway protein K